MKVVNFVIISFGVFSKAFDDIHFSGSNKFILQLRQDQIDF